MTFFLSLVFLIFVLSAVLYYTAWIYQKKHPMTREYVKKLIESVIFDDGYAFEGIEPEWEGFIYGKIFYNKEIKPIQDACRKLTDYKGSFYYDELKGHTVATTETKEKLKEIITWLEKL